MWALSLTSDAGARRRQTKLICPNHRPTPWLTEKHDPAIARTACQAALTKTYVLGFSDDSSRNSAGTKGSNAGSWFDTESNTTNAIGSAAKFCWNGKFLST